jgi:hypothetical protein
MGSIPFDALQPIEHSLTEEREAYSTVAHGLHQFEFTDVALDDSIDPSPLCSGLHDEGSRMGTRSR